MTVYPASIFVRAGHTLTVDGTEHRVIDRCEYPEGSDTFVVETDGERVKRHIDWFADVTAEADRVVIEYAGRHT